VVKLAISDFLTAGSGDTVSIYDGNTMDSVLVAYLYASVDGPLLIQSTQPTMLLVFTTNTAAVSRGFSAAYTSVVTGKSISPSC